MKEFFIEIGQTFSEFFKSTGIAGLDIPSIIMMIVALVLIYLAITKEFEPYLLIPIAIGMLLVNFPGNQLLNKNDDGFLAFIQDGLKVYPQLIFLAVGATTDFGPLMANPKSVILGGAAQVGIFITLIGAVILGFNAGEAAAIGIIGGADGPTSIYISQLFAPNLLSAITVSAYSYMALVPIIQPFIIKLMTTKKERMIHMPQVREVSQFERIVFPIIVMIIVILIIPSTASLIGMLMFGNLIKESGVVSKLTETAGNALLYIITILLGLSVGAQASAANFLNFETLKILALGLFAFSMATACGVLGGKVMNVITKGNFNPMIGAAGVSAMPMAARVVHKLGQEEDPSNFLLMHAMGTNVAGQVGSAVAAGVILALFA
ncbi:MAG: sodium ion-translocating decarboxylase subunit beta [Bacilli bacterium]|jgi:sodium ion-translocating decarboxylase beta subunit|nr:sodium ion-translocating decarboxylase subunit beta [Acholeplasmataceae bacterium]